jgi:anti-sigma factor RsiW
LRVQAYFDGEVDAVSAIDVEHHAEHCPECRALLEDLARTRARLRAGLEFASAPPELRAALARRLDAEAAVEAPRPRFRFPAPGRARPFWLGAAGGAGAALAASLALFLWSPPPRETVLDGMVSAHVRSLLPQHLTDVISTDRHTVKPWFAGHADVSPVVADFTPAGYRLLGGRVDYLEQQRAAVVVYEHGPHIINVFTWAAGGRALPQFSTHSGYHIACWKSGDLQSCAVSDTGWDELQGLVRLIRETGGRDTPR